MNTLFVLSVLGVAVAIATLRAVPLLRASPDLSTTPQGGGAFFDKVAPRYDVLNRAISLGLDQSWRRAAAKAAQPLRSAQQSTSTGVSALDVATGTGDLAIMLASSGDFDNVHAIDPSHVMLSKLQLKAGTTVRTFLGAAEKLPFDDGQFNAVTVAFGVRNFANREQGLREMSRVLVSGGRLVILEVSVPIGQGAFDVAARFFIRTIMPGIGAIVSGRFSDYKYLSTSMAAFPQPEDFVPLLRQAGMELESHCRLWPFGTGPDLYIAIKS